MGFECGFYKMPRFKNYTGHDVAYLSRYFEWERSYKDKFSFEDFVGGAESESPTNDGEKLSIVNDKEAVEFYKGHLHDTGYGYIGIIDTVDYWCSVGRLFNKWFIDKCNNGVDDCRLHNELTKDLMIEAVDYVNEYLYEHRLIEGRVVSAFKENYETEEKTVMPCDGIEIELENGLLKRIYSDYDNVYVLSEGDLEEYQAFERLKSTLVDMILKTDFDKDMVYYFTSW